MFHDPELDRLTDGSGSIPSKPYVGDIEHLRTLQQPAQPIPKFDEALELLMKPENNHVKFNIDIKPNNPPERLFSIMHKSISKYTDYENRLAPRLILGLWHPKFIEPAKNIIPYAHLAHIGMSTSLARSHFFDHVKVLSMSFSSLISSDGQAFLKQCKESHKGVMVWTVNNRSEMVEASKWGVDGIITDETKYFVQLRKDMESDFDAISNENGLLFPWSSLKYYKPLTDLAAYLEIKFITLHGGQIERAST
ncbi:Phosphatidylglycerol phospholipase C [Wallemia ichthyophaga EXF-994]|uniref:Phosphatidylglycerol phospholipase C n=1 Tax=Wallemia ichthyophaga (strain EXF-994 / CBS 113033) TaxID=1299270 RepID=R9ANB6_WALI9|nr:Phosphatidylglycerol phospholipase C [Wallemia ichthyophaga EXF-994]EOR03663.1 Phosphatidylglycerol phospholipase C [Wallemia ichthyophaga EXF-994]